MTFRNNSHARAYDITTIHLKSITWSVGGTYDIILLFLLSSFLPSSLTNAEYEYIIHSRIAYIHVIRTYDIQLCLYIYVVYNLNISHRRFLRFIGNVFITILLRYDETRSLAFRLLS